MLKEEYKVGGLFLREKAKGQARQKECEREKELQQEWEQLCG